MLDCPSAGDDGEETAPENFKRTTSIRRRDEVDDCLWRGTCRVVHRVCGSIDRQSRYHR